jgi:hypothetical protein
MLIPPSFQRRIYDRCLDEIDHPTERDVLNAYLTSFFNAWLDNQNLYGYERKKWVTAFMPRLLAPGKPGRPNVRKLERFREIYPDGRLISIVRDPVSWFASARAWSSRGEWTDRDEAVEAWCASAQRAVTLRESEGEDSILLLAFEDLLVHTGATIRLLAKRLGIQPTGSMMLPTFNSMPIRANSSFAAGHVGVNREPLERGKELSADDAAYIRDRAWDLYERALRLTLRDRPRKARKKPAAPA